jgi:hypothetical protein
MGGVNVGEVSKSLGENTVFGCPDRAQPACGGPLQECVEYGVWLNQPPICLAHAADFVPDFGAMGFFEEDAADD